MNRTTAKRLFDPHRPLYCRRELTEGGHTFGIGDEFPWEQLGLRPEHVLPLFRHRHVGHDRLVDEEKPDGVAPEAEALTDESGNRLDGPTIEEWVGAGYLPEHYPPRGWAIKPSDGLLAWNARQAGGEVLVVLPWDEAAVQKRRTENEEYAARQARAELSTQPLPVEPLPEPPAPEALAPEPAPETAATPEEPQPEPLPEPELPVTPAPEPRRKKR